jgi:RNA polymerase sigma factor (sigma-70 family)
MITEIQTEVLTQDSIAGLYTSHAKELFLFANSILHNPDDAEEIVHDIFCTLYEKAPERKIQNTSMRAFLFVSVKNRALNLMKRDKRTTALSDVHADPHNLSETVNDSVAFDEVQQFVRKNFQPETCEIFNLRVVHGLVWKEISAIVGRPLTSVYISFNEMISVLRERFPNAL